MINYISEMSTISNSNIKLRVLSYYSDVKQWRHITMLMKKNCFLN